MENEGSERKDAQQQLDCEGFLNDTEFWSVDLAETLAKDNEIAVYGLTEAHWVIINYVRDYYREFGRGPEMVKVVKSSGFTMNEICHLFPCGLVKGVYKVAGLPRPPGCI